MTSSGESVVELKMTCLACPAQWEGRMSDGRWVYVRFRHGRLSLGYGVTLSRAVRDDAVIYSEEGDRGDMDLSEMLERTGLVLGDRVEVDDRDA